MERYVYSLFPHLSPVISVPATEYFLGDNSALNTLNQSKTMDTWKIWNELGDLRCHGRVLFHEAELFRTGRRERLRETGGRTCQHTHTHTYTRTHTHTRPAQSVSVVTTPLHTHFQTVTDRRATAASAAVFKRSKLISTD